jgi:minor extracellular serine protease Vpr
MRTWSLRLVVALVCVAGLAVAPAGAGGSASLAGWVGGASNETATKWFVELSSPPSVKGTSKERLKGERDAFKKNASAAGVQITERFAFDTLWNGVSVSVPASQVAALRSVDGVKAVHPVHTVSIPPETGGGPEIDLKNAVTQTQADQAQDIGFDGSGVTIAIMDSGLDYTLPELGGCSAVGPNCKVRGGFDLVGDSYNGSPSSPAFQPVPHPDNDPAPCNPNDADAAEAAGKGTSDAAHGTHVAGIAAADGRGHEAEGQVVGVAPGAKLLAYRVFGCNGSTDTDVMINAMQLALADHADVLNMSIGSAFNNWPQSPEAVASDNLVEAGMVVVASIGNSGIDRGQLWSAGAPGVGTKVIGVASFDNTKATLPLFSAGGTLYSFNRAGGTAAATPVSGNLPIQFSATPPTVPTAPEAAPTADGCAAYSAGSLAGKVVFIRRGTCVFYNKAINAQNGGASAVVLYNNQAGALNATVAIPPGSPPNSPFVAIPVVAITAADARAIFDSGATTLTWTDQTAESPIPTAGLISSFSSIGTDAELTLKPDIGGPGGQIYSTWPHQQFGGHNTLSGTSMSSPHVAGLAALILDAKNNSVSPGIVRTLLMNTAMPKGLNLQPVAGLEPVTRQGAGMAQVVDAISTAGSVTPSKISLGEGNGGSAQLTVRNEGASAITYNLSGVSALTQSPRTVPSNPLSYPFLFDFFGGSHTATFSSPSVTVPAGGSATVNVNIVAGNWRDQSLFGGYIKLTPQGGGVTLSVPYVGFKGDYQSLPVLTAANCGLPAVFQIKAGASDACLGGGISRLGAAEATFTLQGSDIPILLFHFNHQVRLMNIQVYKADGSPVHPVFNYADQEAFLSRNSANNTFFEFDWDGTRSQDNGGGNGDHRKAVPNGTYKLRLSVLKALGNPNVEADWERFTSPPITLARP